MLLSTAKGYQAMGYYDENAQQFFDTTAHLDMGELYRPFLARLPSHGTLLDAGCGSGRDANHFKTLGYEVMAFDSSPELVKKAQDQFKIDVHLASFLDFKFGRKFDGIWACASLLHVSSKDLPAALSNLENHLKDKGVMYCSFKYGDFEGERNGRYFVDMTETRLAKVLAEHTGLRLDYSWITNDIRPGRAAEKWLNCLVVKF